MNTGLVLIVMDEKWDRELFTTIWDELDYDYTIQLFDCAEDLLSFVQKEETKPFLIISDVNLTGMDGFELKEKLVHDHSLNMKTVPFIFVSTSASNEDIERAYDLGAHGFFVKGNGIDEVRRNIIAIAEYWRLSRVPKG